MKIIQITANENGVRPPLQNWNSSTPPIGYAFLPDEFVHVFYLQDKQCAGFVDITVEGDTVTACNWNEEAYQVYIASLPEPEPNPKPTAYERIAILEQENKLLTQQVDALSSQNDFQEELIVELANIVYA